MNVLLIFGCYLLGGVSFARHVGKRVGVDPLTQGSGNPGATNMLRVGGRKAGALTLAGDVVKGFLPTLLAIGRPAVWASVFGCAAVIGHMFPVQHRFKGGKGVATAAGAAFGSIPLVGIIAAVVFGVTAKATKKVSAGSLAATVPLLTLPVLFNYDLVACALWAVVAMMIVWRHGDNLKRLLRGTELDPSGP